MRDRKGFSSFEFLIVIAIASAILGGIFVPALQRERAHRAACVNNLKQLGLILSLYSAENRDKYPPKDNVYNKFMFDTNAMYCEYLSDVAIMACPGDPEHDHDTNFRLLSAQSLSDNSWGAETAKFCPGNVHPNCIGPLSYVYTGWVVITDSECLGGLGSLQTLRRVLSISDPVTDGWRDRNLNLASFGMTTSGNMGGYEIQRLSGNLDGDVPVMWDILSTNTTEINHTPDGQNVLYLDGHVEWHRYEGDSELFPLSPLYAAIAGKVDPKDYTYCP